MKTLEKALDILDAIAREPSGLNAEELAQRIGTNKTTSYKIATVFCKYGYLQRIPQTTKYILSGKFLEMAQHVDCGSEIRDIALPEMHRLALQSGETINLMILSGTKGLYVEVLESEKSAKLASSVGALDYLHVSAVGKVLLAGMSEQAVNHVLAAEGLPKTGKNTITTPQALREELENVRRQGYAIDDEESVPGARCVAAPIRNGAGEVVAAVSISSLTISSSIERLGVFIRLVVDAAHQISQALAAR